MSDDMQPISAIAPMTGMSTSNLRRLALEGVVPAQKTSNGRYLVKLSDVLAYCASTHRAGASRAPIQAVPTREEASNVLELAATRSQLAALEAENKRIKAELGRAHERAEKLEERVLEIMGLYSKMMVETQALLAGATGTQPTNWVHTSTGDSTGQSGSRGFKGLFNRAKK